MNMDVASPLLFVDMPFQPGNCLEQIDHIKNAAAMDPAMMQYYYFTCRHELAAEKAAPYLNSVDLKIRIPALLVFSFSHMAMGHIKEVQAGTDELRRLASAQVHYPSESGISLMLFAVKTMLHIPVTASERKEIDAQSYGCTEGGRPLCCYLLEQQTWNNGEYERIIGDVEIAMHMTKNSYPLIALFLYLSASEAALHLKDTLRAEAYFQKAWELAEADGFWEPFGEFHGHVEPFLEKTIKHEKPVLYKQLLTITHQHCSGWRNYLYEGRLPKEEQKKREAQETLTGMEHAVAYLAALGWSNQEISDFFGIAVRTVKYHMTTVFYKLNIENRQQIFALLLD